MVLAVNKRPRRSPEQKAAEQARKAVAFSEARARECPVCGAGPGVPCMETYGLRAGLSVRMHAPRLVAIASTEQTYPGTRGRARSVADCARTSNDREASGHATANAALDAPSPPGLRDE